MKISRRGLAGVAAGAVAAVNQKEQAAQQLAQTPPYPKMNYPGVGTHIDKLSTALQQDPDYYTNQIKHYKKILSGDFSDVMYQFEDNTRGRMYANIESLKSISATARQTLIENEINRRKKKELIANARANLDIILGLPFSVTGILFDE